MNPFHWTLAAVAAGVEKLSRWRTASILYMAEVPTQEKLVEVRLRIVLAIGPIEEQRRGLANARHKGLGTFGIAGGVAREKGCTCSKRVPLRMVPSTGARIIPDEGEGAL